TQAFHLNLGSVTNVAALLEDGLNVPAEIGRGVGAGRRRQPQCPGEDYRQPIHFRSVLKYTPAEIMSPRRWILLACTTNLLESGDSAASPAAIPYCCGHPPTAVRKAFRAA